MSKIIGIDLGSCNSCVAVMEGGRPTIIVNEEGGRTTPSVISFGEERKIGNAAKRQAIVNPKDTVILIKRFMGGTYDEVKESISHVQYEVKNVGGNPRIVIKGKEYAPEELSAMILGKMKSIAEEYLNEEVKDAVITVPAYFTESAKEATKRAGEIAGLNVLRLVAEPTAAILASNIDMQKGGKYLVVDYGGATLDFSVADISGGVVEILASNGDVYCGGSDLDKMVANYLVETFKKDNNVDLTKDPMAMSRIYEAAEKAKCELSQTTSTEINLPYITAVDGMPMHFVTTLTRAKFDEIIDKEIAKVIKYGKDALAKANVKAEDLTGVLLVGGSTRIPKVQTELVKAFGDKLMKNVNPDEAVSLGASVQASILAGEKTDILLLDVCPISLGIETMGGVMTKLIDANTTIPTKKTNTFSTAEDNQPAVTIMVCQGERPMARDNKLLGNFTLDGIMPARRGVPQIEVTFDVDANGILTVSAVDKGTGKEQHITIDAPNKLSDAEVERMKKEAEKYAEEDKKKKEAADIRNNADSLVFQTEKLLDESKDKLTDEQKSSLETPLKELKEALEKNEADKLKGLTDTLQQAWYKVSGELYQKANPQGGAAGQNPFGSQNPFGGGDLGGANPFANAQ